MRAYGDYEVLRSPLHERLLAYALKKVRRGYYPKMVNFAVTYRCSGRCVMCNIWKRKPSREVSVDDVEFMFDDRLMRKARLVKISGGEALLREDITEILKIIESKTRALMVISTNGLRASRKNMLEVLENIENSRLVFSVSLDAMGSRHSFMRGVPGAFEQVMETLEILKKKGVEHRLSVTVTQFNSEEFSEVLEFARRNGLYAGYRLADISKVYYDNAEKMFRFSRDVLQTVEKYADNSFKKGISEWVRGRRPHRCYALITSIFVDPRGLLHPCIYREAIADLKQVGLSEVWNSPEMVEVRKRIENCSRCWTDCQAIPDILTGL